MDAAKRKDLHANMVRFARGERTAFDSVFTTLFPALRDFTERILHREQDAEDAAQHALLKVFARIAEFDHEQDALSWAYAIAHNEVRTLLQKWKRAREDLGDVSTQLSSNAGSPEAQAQSSEELRSLERALDRLSHSEREALAVDNAEPAARKRKQRAMQRLREIWRKLNGPE